MKARLPKGVGGGGGQDMNTMIRQAQKMQALMEEKQNEIGEQTFSTTAGGGAISVELNGKKEVLSITLSPEIVDPTDIDMLQDLIVAAVNEGLRKVEDITNAEMEKITGGLNVPGMM